MYKLAKRLFWMFLISLLFLLSACNRQDQPIYDTISEASLHAGDTIPLPNQETILTISGNIGTSNQEDQIVMDIPTIESVGQVAYTVMDPFKDIDITYTGVLLNDLLDVWQVSDTATSLHITALNDYQVEVPIQMIHDYPIIYAMQADDVYMSVSDKGPAMLVLPYDDYEFERPSADAYWIWQIKSIEVN
jgi:hypothetical protein